MKFSEASESAWRGDIRTDVEVVLCRINRIHGSIINYSHKIAKYVD